MKRRHLVLPWVNMLLSTISVIFVVIYFSRSHYEIEIRTIFFLITIIWYFLAAIILNKSFSISHKREPRVGEIIKIISTTELPQDSKLNDISRYTIYEKLEPTHVKEYYSFITETSLEKNKKYIMKKTSSSVYKGELILI